jgi:hypothetical protein
LLLVYLILGLTLSSSSLQPRPPRLSFPDYELFSSSDTFPLLTSAGTSHSTGHHSPSSAPPSSSITKKPPARPKLPTAPAQQTLLPSSETTGPLTGDGFHSPDSHSRETAPASLLEHTQHIIPPKVHNFIFISSPNAPPQHSTLVF